MQFCNNKEIICKLMLLSKRIRQLLREENYFLFKRFLAVFSLHKRLKKSDVVAQVDILDLFKRNMSLQNTPIKRVDPHVYQTDGGVDGDMVNYSLH